MLSGEVSTSKMHTCKCAHALKKPDTLLHTFPVPAGLMDWVWLCVFARQCKIIVSQPVDSKLSIHFKRQKINSKQCYMLVCHLVVKHYWMFIDVTLNASINKIQQLRNSMSKGACHGDTFRQVRKKSVYSLYSACLDCQQSEIDSVFKHRYTTYNKTVLCLCGKMQIHKCFLFYNNVHICFMF